MDAVLERQIAGLREEIAGEETKARELKEAVDADRDERAEAGENFLTDDALFNDFDARYREADEHAQRAAELRTRLDASLVRAAANQGRGGAPSIPLNRQERRAFAQIAKRYMQSDAYKRLRESGVLASAGSKVNHDPVEVIERGGFDEEGNFSSELIDALRQRATMDIGSGGALVPIDQQVWPPVEIPVRQIRLLDLISMATTESDMVNFVQQTLRSDTAAETPYGTVAPEAAYAFALRQASVKRVPTFIPATKDVLADQGQLQGLLQDQLMTGVRLDLESQFLAGAGTSPSDAVFQGILNAAGIGTVTYQSGTGHTAEYQLDVYHRAITTIRLTLFADPTAIVAHPIDYEWAVLKKDAYGRYLFEPNTEDDVKTIWGLQTVISPVIPQGSALAGDFKAGARMWLRTGLSVTASTEHADFFTRGMVAILAELRAAFAVIQPRAFCTVNALTGP